MIILSIDTSCDETAIAVTSERKVFANAIYSQVLIHKKWGGVVPSLAKRAHIERIDLVLDEALRKFKRNYMQPFKNMSQVWEKIDAIAVTQGPGLAVALEVGIAKAKELAVLHNKKLVAVNHLEGHMYSAFVQNKNGNPARPYQFPYLALIISGGHTSIVLWENHLKYQVLGETIDDAAGEALDKAGKLMGLGYPCGAVIEKLSKDIGNKDIYAFPRPMLKQKGLDFSFSGLKTSFYYHIKELGESEKNKHLHGLLSSFQEAVFDTIVKKTNRAILQTGIRRLCVGGGVIANVHLRNRFRKLVAKHDGSVLFPPYKYLTGDNAAMIGVAAHYRLMQNDVIKDVSLLDRIARMRL